MKLLSLATAAILAVTLAAPAPEASAASKAKNKTQGKHIAVCVPGRPSPYCPPHYWRPNRWPHHNWYSGHYYGYQPWPYYHNPYYDDDFHVANRMTCNYAKGLMERRGYRSVKATDCSGTYYGFTGIKKGHKFKITLNSYSGRYSVRHVNWFDLRVAAGRHPV
jgi:hypothetical protein